MGQQDKTFEFVIQSWSDLDYAKNPENQRTSSWKGVYLERYPIMFRSGTQKYLCLSVTEAELSTGVTCTQDMLHVVQVMPFLKVKLPNTIIVYFSKFIT